MQVRYQAALRPEWAKYNRSILVASSKECQYGLYLLA